MKKNEIQQLFEIKDLIGKVPKNTCILTKNEYVEFIRKPSQLKLKKIVFLRPDNIKKDENNYESGAKKISSNSEVFFIVYFLFFLYTFFISLYKVFRIKQKIKSYTEGYI